MKENALEAALHSLISHATMTTEPTETEALLKKDASASPEPNAKSARVGEYVKAGLALAGVLGVCALGKAFEGNLVDAYRVAVGCAYGPCWSAAVMRPSWACPLVSWPSDRTTTLSRPCRNPASTT